MDKSTGCMGHRYDWLFIGVLSHDVFYSQFEKIALMVFDTP
jgi:hypothetical protein